MLKLNHKPLNSKIISLSKFEERNAKKQKMREKKEIFGPIHNLNQHKHIHQVTLSDLGWEEGKKTEDVGRWLGGCQEHSSSVWEKQLFKALRARALILVSFCFQDHS